MNQVPASFPHHAYTSTLPANARYRFAVTPAPIDIDSEESVTRFRVAGQSLMENNVSALYLIHGTFVGNDPLGIWESFGQCLPGWSARGRRIQKSFIDGVLNDHGSYPKWLARFLEKSLNGDDSRRLIVHRFNWSSRNNHLGRALATLELLARLVRDGHTGRIVLWGHSHGGNVMALFTNLLQASREDRQQFLAAIEPFIATSSKTYNSDVPSPAIARREARDLLLSDKKLLEGVAIDYVTFGTPVRHCWTLNPTSRLMHFINHRPVPGREEYLGKHALKCSQTLVNLGDDFVQQIGIAGSNIAPSCFCPASRKAEKKLKALFQPDIGWRDLWKNVATGRRLPDTGSTVFGDYVSNHGKWATIDAGHLIYTRRKHLLFHLEQMNDELYSGQELYSGPS